MSNDAATIEHEADHDDHGAHLTFSGAIKIAIFLALITGIETLTYFLDFGGLAKPVIIIMMLVKFTAVAAYFMHLRFDNWMFTFLFVVGIVLTLIVYAGTLGSMNYWGG